MVPIDFDGLTLMRMTAAQPSPQSAKEEQSPR
jgi:hypothetical protein